MRTVLNRRRRFWRSLLIALLAVVVMTLVALANRDAQALRAARKAGDAIVKGLQQHVEKRHNPPLTMPLLPEPYQNLDRRYYFNIFYVGTARDLGEAGVCCMREPLQFFVFSDGRIVVTYDGNEFTPLWMEEAEFRANAERLGFGSLLDD